MCSGWRKVPTVTCAVGGERYLYSTCLQWVEKGTYSNMCAVGGERYLYSTCVQWVWRLHWGEGLN